MTVYMIFTGNSQGILWISFSFFQLFIFPEINTFFFFAVFLIVLFAYYCVPITILSQMLKHLSKYSFDIFKRIRYSFNFIFSQKLFWGPVTLCSWTSNLLKCENKILLSKLPSLWYLVMADLANEYISVLKLHDNMPWSWSNSIYYLGTQWFLQSGNSCPLLEFSRIILSLISFPIFSPVSLCGTPLIQLLILRSYNFLSFYFFKLNFCFYVFLLCYLYWDLLNLIIQRCFFEFFILLVLRSPFLFP